MINRYLLLRAFVLSAVRQKTNTKTPTQILEDVVIGRFTSEVQDGKTLISTTEAGGTATFALMADMSPAEIVSLAMEAIVWIQEQADPNNPPPYPTRRIKRFRASFAKATI